MKIFTAEQIRKAEAYTIAYEPVTSLKLMERAAEACTRWLLNHFPNKTTYQIFCGTGNNGGDGLAIARLLAQQGLKVNVFTEEHAKNLTEDCAVNLQRLKEMVGIAINSWEEFSAFSFSSNSVVIDALFGTGLNRPVEGSLKEVILRLNQLPYPTVSIDVPSGLNPDVLFEDKPAIVKADFTLSFQFWKRTFLHPESGIFVGKVEILDIGLDSKFIESEPSDFFVTDDVLAKKLYRPRNKFSHKGTYGKSKIIAGSFGKIGAAVLAAKAALRSGSGLTTVQAPDVGYDILQTSYPEAMFVSGGEKIITSFRVAEDEVAGIGPGLGTELETSTAFLKFLEEAKHPLILDADALNILSQNSEKLKLLPVRTVITPHPKEFARLFGESKNSFERLNLAMRKAKDYQIYIVLKDHHTQVVTPEGKVYYNITGNSGLAKGGSGDVLLGIITSLVTQGYPSQDACVFGVWLHGKAADFAADTLAKESMLATDVINCLSDVFRWLNKNP